MKVSAILPAAGSGTRLRSKTSKPFIKIFGKPLILYTLIALQRAYAFKEILIATSAENMRPMRKLIEKHRLKKIQVVQGGRTRAESVWKALNAVRSDSDYVLVHDAARPLVDKKIISDLLEEVRKSKAVICAVPVTSTVKRVKISTNEILKTEKREQLFLAQTPQVFQKTLLFSRYLKLGKRAFEATDEASLFDGSAVKVKITAGSAHNMKVTFPEDIELFKYLNGRK